MSYDKRHCWLTQISHPRRSHAMLYGCRCGVVGKSKFFKTSAEIRFFWLLLSTIKCSGVPFTHIYEWKIYSPSSRSSGSSGWIVMVATVEVGSTSIICLLLLLYESDSMSRLRSVSLSSTTNECFEQHSLVLCQGILWKSHHFPVSFFIFQLPFFSDVLDWWS
jgi:hypothetical protein